MIRHVHELNGKLIRELVGRDDPLLLEIGCADGVDTMEFLNAMPRATIHCFEPDRRCRAAFRERVGRDYRVRLHEVAVSNVDGEALFYASSGSPADVDPSHYSRPLPLKDWYLSGSLCRPTGHLEYSPWVTFPPELQREVGTIRLDTWAKERPFSLESIDFIWMDVQGAERLVLEGATETLTRTRFLYTEFSDKPMYAGQPSLKEIQALLGESWELVGVYARDNALFRNATCKSN